MKTILLVFLVALAFGKDVVDPRLKDVRTVFVTGNNQAAEKIRSEMRTDAGKKRSCLSLITNPSQADATLEVAADRNLTRNSVTRESDWIINGTLTTKSGDIIWSSHAQFSDAPFMSGGDTAGKILYRHLKSDACGK